MKDGTLNSFELVYMDSGCVALVKGAASIRAKTWISRQYVQLPNSQCSTHLAASDHEVLTADDS